MIPVRHASHQMAFEALKKVKDAKTGYIFSRQRWLNTADLCFIVIAAYKAKRLRELIGERKIIQPKDAPTVRLYFSNFH